MIARHNQLAETRCKCIARWQGDEIPAKRQLALKQLCYEKCTGRKQLWKSLFNFKEADLKLQCNELCIKTGTTTKAEIVE